MRRRRLGIVGFVIAAVSGAALAAGELPSEPRHDSGQSITAAYEGWFENPDGTFSFLIGYYNRNLKQELEIPIGPSNRIEPGGPDRGQPTHFQAGRQWGLFTVTVPKDFGTNKLTWTLVANGATTSIPFSLDPLWVISPLVDATGNTPPFISFGKEGPMVQGPRPISVDQTSALNRPLTLTVWVADDAKMPPGTLARAAKATPVSVAWSKFRGPGVVTFAAIGLQLKNRIGTRLLRPSSQEARQLLSRLANQASTFCVWSPTTYPATAAGGSNAAGPTRLSTSP